MQALLEQRVRTWTTPPAYYINRRVEHVSLFSFNHLREEVEGLSRDERGADRADEWPEAGDVGFFPRSRDRGAGARTCIGCARAWCMARRMFVLDSDRKAIVTQADQEWSPMDGGYIRHCPTYAISRGRRISRRKSGNQVSQGVGAQHAAPLPRSVSPINFQQLIRYSIPIVVRLYRFSSRCTQLFASFRFAKSSRIPAPPRRDRPDRRDPSLPIAHRVRDAA